jgi:tetratricopeptide (TPR) repeat protein
MNKPSLSDAHMFEAMQLQMQGQLDAARTSYEELLKQSPKDLNILQALGKLCFQMQDWDAASEYLRLAITVNARQPEYLLMLAQAYVKAGKPERAMDVLAKLLKIDHNHPAAQTMLCDLCLPETKEMGMKRSPINRLIAANPQVLGLRAVAIMLCRKMDDYRERLGHLEVLHRAGARTESLYTEYGVMLRDNGHFERAMDFSQKAVAAFPQSVDLMKLRANMYFALGHYTQALEDWQCIATMAPQDYQARSVIGMIKMLLSDCREGTENLSAIGDKMLALYNLKTSIPEWRGESLAGKHILLWSNEGIGDSIMFASFLPWALAQGAKVTLALFGKLIPLFARSFPEVDVIPYMGDTFVKYTGKCDLHAAVSQLLSYGLPHYVPAENPPFLQADSERVATLRKKYQALAPQKKLVGISWYTKNKDTFSQRNIALADWKPIFTLPTVQCISLQYGDHKEEIEAVNKKFPGAMLVDPEIDAFGDLDALAAQMLAIDEIVSIDNSTVHLSGALGVKTTMLLSASSEWRWGLNRTNCLWYGSLIIERQQKLLDWQPVLSRMRAKLAS